MEKLNSDDKTKVLRIDTEDFDLFQKLMIDYIVDNEKIISKKEFFGVLIQNAKKKGSHEDPKNTLLI